MKLKNTRRKALYVTSSVPHHKVKRLTAYFMQGGKWKKLKKVAKTYDISL